MPTLLIFDDDLRKIRLAEKVLSSLTTICPATQWTLGFKKRISSLNIVKCFLETLARSKDPLLLLDIEIKWESRKKGEVDWRRPAEESIKKIGNIENERYEQELQSLRKIFHQQDDYDLSLHLFAFAKIHRIPVIVISTKASSVDGDRHETKALIAGIPSINNWTVSWEKDWIEPNRKQIIAGIATAVNLEWEKWKGTMEQRLWPAEAVTGAGWFSGDNCSHKAIPHRSDNEKCKALAYTQRIKQYVEAVTGRELSATWKPIPKCHDALKQLVGACAKAHANTGEGYVPQLNTVALLAASWDPNAPNWFSSFNWESTCALMREAATQIQLRQAVLALGGEDGLFAKLIPREGDLKVSNLTSITAKADCLTLTFNFDLSKDKHGGTNGIKQLFEAARKPANSSQKSSKVKETSLRLIDAWKKLAIDGKRLIDIEVTNREIIFRKELKL